MKGFTRADDFETRREHLKGLSKEQLKALFWENVEKIVDPLLVLAKENTTPSIERSVLLRMGFSSLEAQSLVTEAIARNLMGYGVGHVVYVVMNEKGLSARDAGLALIEGKYWEDAAKILKGEIA
ncbi:D-ornithine 4,5-aminomutase subunit OraS [Guggenheimella bovis]